MLQRYRKLCPHAGSFEYKTDQARAVLRYCETQSVLAASCGLTTEGGPVLQACSSTIQEDHVSGPRDAVHPHFLCVCVCGGGDATAVPLPSLLIPINLPCQLCRGCCGRSPSPLSYSLNRRILIRVEKTIGWLDIFIDVQMGDYLTSI